MGKGVIIWWESWVVIIVLVEIIWVGMVFFDNRLVDGLFWYWFLVGKNIVCENRR